MTVDEVKQMRLELECLLKTAIVDFQDKTGCKVESVDLDRRYGSALRVDIIVGLPH